MDKNKMYYREIAIENPKEDRSVDLAFSSEFPVQREFRTSQGWKTVQEILDHTPTSVDLSRLENNAPMLWMHDPEKMIGVVDAARIDADKVGRATVRFGNQDLAQQIWRDVQEKIVTKVSVGYKILEVAEENMDKDIPTIRATKWMPFEISAVSVAADDNVGIGRSETEAESRRDQAETEEEDRLTAEKNLQRIDEAETQKSDAQKITMKENISGVRKMNELEIAKAEKKRISDIDALTDKWSKHVDGIRELRNTAVEQDWTSDQYAAKLMSNLRTEPITADAKIGMSKKEVERYSLRNAIMSQVPNSGVDGTFEKEASEETAKRMGVAPRGIYVPHDVMLRGFSVLDGATQGANLVGTELQGSNFIDLLRNRTVADKVGVQFLTGLVGSVAIPKRSTAGSIYWVAENSAITVTTGSISQITLSPKIIGCWTDYSKKLLAQSTPSIDTLIMNDFASIMALGIDHAVLHGAGTNEPTGLAITSGVVSSSMATGSWGGVVDLESQVLGANATGQFYCVTTPTIVGGLKKSPKVSGQPVYILTDNNNLNGYPVISSNQVDSGYVFFGDFSQVILGQWGSLDVVVDPYTSATSNQVRVIANQMVDVGVRQIAALTYAYGCTHFEES